MDDKNATEKMTEAEKIIAELTKDKPIKKEAQTKKASPPIKAQSYFDVKVESMIPATLTYRVLAESPEQAADLIRGMSPIGVKHRLVGKRDIKLSVYDAGSCILKWAKNLGGR